jgi:multiple sugar transport system permease protein
MNRADVVSRSRRWSRLVMVLALLWTLFPIGWAFVLSIKRPPDFFSAKIVPFVQFQPTLENWQAEWRALGDEAGLGRGVWNSLVVGMVATALTLVLALLLAFGLSLRRGARLVDVLAIACLMLPRVIPPLITALPFSIVMRAMGLADTLLALAIAHTTLALPLAALLLYSAIAELPAELLDAAMIDGCRPLAALVRVVAPAVAWPLVVTGALCFIQSWNEFLFALLNLQQRAQTAPLLIAALLNKDGVEFEYVGSHLLIVTLPPLLLALLIQQILVRGLSLGMPRNG